VSLKIVRVEHDHLLSRLSGACRKHLPSFLPREIRIHRDDNDACWNLSPPSVAYAQAAERCGRLSSCQDRQGVKYAFGQDQYWCGKGGGIEETLGAWEQVVLE